MTRPSPLSASERQRRRRERLRAGVVVVPVPMTEGAVAALIAFGWIGEAESENRARIGEAVSALLEDMAAASKKNRHA